MAVSQSVTPPFKRKKIGGATVNLSSGTTNLKLVPYKVGAPGEIRTPDHQVRSLVLYPTELRAHKQHTLKHWIFETRLLRTRHFLQRPTL